jgi:Fe/S biogenesis protein NfuA
MSLDTTDTLTEPIVTVTDAARERVLEIRSQDEAPDELGLRIEITGQKGVDYTYDLALEPISESVEGDHVHTDLHGLTIMVPPESVDRLRGAVLDLPAAGQGAGTLVIRNPNRPDPMDAKSLKLTGSLPEKVQQLLDQRVNPALAGHGGWTTLVGVDGSKVYLTMGGGCQGCSMSAATLVEGIQRSILEAIPEVTEVIDATDHSAGENPFYA